MSRCSRILDVSCVTTKWKIKAQETEMRPLWLVIVIGQNNWRDFYCSLSSVFISCGSHTFSCVPLSTISLFRSVTGRKNHWYPHFLELCYFPSKLWEVGHMLLLGTSLYQEGFRIPVGSGSKAQREICSGLLRCLHILQTRNLRLLSIEEAYPVLVTGTFP